MITASSVAFSNVFIMSAVQLTIIGVIIMLVMLLKANNARNVFTVFPFLNNMAPRSKGRVMLNISSIYNQGELI